MYRKLTRGQTLAVLAAIVIFGFSLVAYVYGPPQLTANLALESILSVPVVAISLVAAVQALRNPMIGKVFQVLIIILFGFCGLLVTIIAFILQSIATTAPDWLLKLLMAIGVLSLVSWLVGMGLFAIAWARWDRQRRKEWSRSSG